MRYSLEDTIVAIASAPGGGLRGIVRLAGSGVQECLGRSFVPKAGGTEGLDWLLGRTSFGGMEGGDSREKGTPKATGANTLSTDSREEPPGTGVWRKSAEFWGGFSRSGVVCGELWLEGGRGRLPCEVYYWPGPRSYTGGPMAEIHTLGCPPLLEAAVRTLCQAGARLAEPGEFTLRAFLSGRIDLTQAEAVLGVVDAVDPEQLTVALEQLAGGLARPLQELRNRLLDLLVDLEAGLDFPDEDLPFLTPEELCRKLQNLERQLQTLAEQLQARRTKSEEVTVLLVGRPNVGKSSLFNVLVPSGQALVSAWPGTTRDYLMGSLDLGTIRCRLVDTAGLEEGTGASAEGTIAAAAQQMTLQQLQQADVYLWCVDGTEPMRPEEWSRWAGRSHAPRLVVVTKADQPIQIDLDQLAHQCGSRPILTSSRTGQGLEVLRTRLRETVEGLIRTGGHAVLATAIRSAESIRLAREALQRAFALAEHTCPEELIAAEVRLALDEIGKVSGAVYTEDLLDRIFSRFCIGK